MALPHGMDVLVGHRGSLDGGFEIERDQQSLDAVVGEVLDDLFLGARHPFALPVLRERLDVRALAADPFRGAGIAVQVNDAHVFQPAPRAPSWTPCRTPTPGSRRRRRGARAA